MKSKKPSASKTKPAAKLKDLPPRKDAKGGKVTVPDIKLGISYQDHAGT